MEKKLKEFRKELENLIEFFDKKEIYGVVSYLEDIYNTLDYAEQELEEYLDNEED